MFGSLNILQHFYQELQGQKFVRLLIGIYLLTREYYQQPIKQSKAQKDKKIFNKMLNLKRNYDQKPKENLYMSKKYVPFQDKEQQNYIHKQSKPLKRQLLIREIKNLQDQRKDIQLTVQEESCQLHRYLKEYQYNTYQPHQTQHEQNDQNKYIANMDLQGRYSSKYSSSNASHIDSRYIKYNQNKENLTNNHQFSFIGLNPDSNMKGKKPQKNNQTSTKNSTEKQLFISKQEIVLLKHLREQNNQLKLEISKKNSYIQDLQQKIQRYLKERIQSQREADNLCKSLQNRLLNAQNQIKSLQKEIEKYKEQQKQHEKSLQFIFKAIKINPSGDICHEQLPKMTKLLQQILQQKNTFNEFIYKIEEMRNKIESKSNKNQSTLGKNHYDSNNNNKVKINKAVNLKQLWKWLKLVAKQYEVMKEKVSLIQKDHQSIGKN